MEVILDLTLKDDYFKFSKDSADLLDAIQKCGSVKHACTNIGISYSKAWNLIRDAESLFGFPLLYRKQGGRMGGYSNLTEEGKSILEKYKDIYKKVGKIADKHVSKNF